VPHELPGSDLASASDADLLELSKQGSSAAFGELWARHAAAGRTVARSFTSSLDPDDLVAEAFTKIFQLLLKGKGPTGAFRPYLFTAIRNTAASWGRARRETSIDTLESFEDPASSEESSLAALDNGLTASAFRALPTRWQEVLWYSEVESMTPAQIAPLLGMSANSVAALSYRAREGLRQAWIGAHLKSENLSDECRWSIEHLGGYTRDGLGKRDTARLEKHLDACAKCTIAASEAEEVGSRLALVLLPLAAGIGGSAAYTHWLQTGGPSSETALAAGPMPLSVTAGSTGTGVAAGTASGASVATVLPTTTLSGGITAITVASVVAGVALAASVAVAIMLGLNPVVPTAPPEQNIAAPEAAPADPGGADAGDGVQADPPSSPPLAPPTVGSPDEPPVESPDVAPPAAIPPAVTPPMTPPVTPPTLPPTPGVTQPEAPTLANIDTGGGALFPAVAGTAEPGATVEFTADAVRTGPVAAARLASTFARAADGVSSWAVTAAAGGEWSATLSGLAPGEYRLSSRQVTTAGEASPAVRSEPFTLAAAPTVAGLADSSHHLGALPPLTFSGLPGAAIEFSADGGARWSSASLDASGGTTATLAPLPVGPAGLHVRYTGDDGRVGPTSITGFSVIPIPAPRFAVDTADGLYFPRISGHGALPGTGSALLDVFLGSTLHATATADAGGSWSTTVTNIAPGWHTPSLSQRIGDSSSPRVAGAPFRLAEPPVLLDMSDGAEYRADEQPSLFFRGVPDADVEYSLDGGDSWSAARVEYGDHGFVELTPLPVGQASVSIRYGSAGRFGPASTVTFTILPMVAPAVPNVTIDTGDGYFFPLVSGTGTEDSGKATTMELFVDGTSLASELVYGNNNWSSIVTGLTPGTHALSVVAHGQNGLSSAPSTAIEFTLKPAPTFEAGSDGTAIRIDKNVYIDIFGVPGLAVNGSLNGSPGSIYMLPASGQAELGYGGLAPGRHTVDIRYMDSGDARRFGPSNSTWFVVTPIPALPAPTVDTGDGRYFPLVSGTGALPPENYSVLTEVAVDGVAQPQLAADALGSWATTVTGLAPGAHTVTATQWTGGKASDTSQATDFTLLAPPALSAGLGGSEHPAHALPPLEFSGVPNATLEYSSTGGSAWTAVTLDGSGQASAVLAAMPVGPATIDVRYADGAGRVGPASSTTFTVSESPPVPVPGFAVDTAGGRVFPLVSGTAALPDERISVRVDDGVAPVRVVSVIADAQGAWSTVIDGLTPGDYQVAVVQSDGARDSVPSAPQSFALAPAPALSDASMNSSYRAGLPFTLEIVGLPSTPDSTAFLGLIGSTDWADFFIDQSGVTTRAMQPASAGQYGLQFRYMHLDGRTGPIGESRYTVDPLPTPAAPTVDTAGGRYVPILTGSGALPNADIQLSVDGVEQSIITTADAFGVWSLPVHLTVTPGEHTATVTQSSGQATSPSSAGTLFTQNGPPALQASLAGSTHPEDALPALEFGGVPGASIEYSFAGIPQSFSAVLDGTGQASVASPTLPVGEATLNVRYFGDGRSGPSGATSFTVTPRTLAVPSFTVDTAGGLYLPIITGNDAEPFASITLQLNGVALPPLSADGNGDWVVTADTVQAGILYQVTARQQLGASASATGNPSSFQLYAPQILAPASNSAHSMWGPITVTLTGLPGAFVAGVLHSGGPVDGKVLYLDGSGGGSASFNESAVGNWTTGQIEVYYADPAGIRKGVSTGISVSGY
jgi:RNA polymerase sigma factor (sigma-70 family)